MSPAHVHCWIERDVPMGDSMIQLRHVCACGEFGVGPEDWCARERQHWHGYEPLPRIAQLASTRLVSALFRLKRYLHFVLLPWALWATLETASVPAVGTPLVMSDRIERFASYQECDRAARWAELQPDLREEWTVTNGRKYHTVVTYSCRQGGTR